VVPRVKGVEGSRWEQVSGTFSQSLVEKRFRIPAPHKCKHRPPHAAVAIPCLDFWHYIDERDHDSRATFALVLRVSKWDRPPAGVSPS
jgi:hypothetical protein